MFGSNTEKIRIRGKVYSLKKEVVDYIAELQRECDRFESVADHLQMELDEVLPVVEAKELKPAVSQHCSSCVHCVKSAYDGKILGCCKDNVCEDYKRKPEEWE